NPLSSSVKCLSHLAKLLSAQGSKVKLNSLSKSLNICSGVSHTSLPVLKCTLSIVNELSGLYPNKSFIDIPRIFLVSLMLNFPSNGLIHDSPCRLTQCYPALTVGMDEPLLS